MKNKKYLPPISLIFPLIFFTSSIGGCASKTDKKPEVIPPSPAVVEVSSYKVDTSSNKMDTKVDTSSDKIEVTDIKLPEIKLPTQAFNPPPPNPPPTHAHAAHDGVAPEVAYRWLQNGNIRFTKNRLRNDGQSQKDVQRLAKGQKPHSIVLSCSDSRVPPEILFDQKLGEIFTVRNAGETLDSSTIASIEYALEHLGASLIVILGHTSCGAVKAAFSTLGGGDAGSPSLNKLVADIHPRLQEFKGQTPSANHSKESWANAKGIAQDLVTRSAIVAEKVRNHQAVIQVGLYQLDSGSIEWDEH